MCGQWCLVLRNKQVYSCVAQAVLTLLAPRSLIQVGHIYQVWAVVLWLTQGGSGPIWWGRAAQKESASVESAMGAPTVNSTQGRPREHKPSRNSQIF